MIEEEKKATSYIDLALDNNKMNLNKAHEVFGHMGEANTRRNCEHLGIKLKKVAFKPCKDCAIGKAKQKNVPKISQGKKSIKLNDRVMIDITTIKKPKKGNVATVNQGNWRMIVDEYSKKKTSHFFKKKCDMVKSTCDQFNRWKNEGKAVEIVRCDNAGENYSLEKMCNGNEYNLNIKFEFTARNTPQQNSLVKKGFDTIYGRDRAILYGALIPSEVRHILFREAFKHAEMMDNLNVETIDQSTKSRYEHFGDAIPNFVAGVVVLKSIATLKVGNRGEVCIFVGYADMHARDCYRMYNPNTKRIHTTRDVRWLKRWYYIPNGTINKQSEVNHALAIKAGKGIEGIELGETLMPINENTTTVPSVQTMNNSISNESDNDNGNSDDYGNDNSDEDENDAMPTTSNTNNNTGWTRVTRSGRATKTPTMFNPETGNVFTVAENNYYKALEDLNEFEPTEVAALAGSDINSKVKSVAANEKYDKFDFTHAYKRVKLKWKKNKRGDESKSLDELNKTQPVIAIFSVNFF